MNLNFEHSMQSISLYQLNSRQHCTNLFLQLTVIKEFSILLKEFQTVLNSPVHVCDISDRNLQNREFQTEKREFEQILELTAFSFRFSLMVFERILARFVFSLSNKK